MEHLLDSNLWIFFALSFGIIVLPGMDMAFIAGSALTAGLRGGALALAGVVAGGVAHVLINLSGVTALLMLWPGAFNALLLAGAAYMGWVGWGLLRAPTATADAAQATAPMQISAAPVRGPGAIFMHGVMNCLLNPKAYAFMLAVFPAFLVTPERGVGAQAALLAGITAFNQIAIYGLVVLAAASAKRFAAPGGSTQRGVSVAVGLILIAMAGITMASAWK